MFNICLFENSFIKVYQTIFKCESYKQKKKKNTFQVYCQHKKYFRKPLTNASFDLLVKNILMEGF
jgi:hypothetical protein